MSWLVGQLWLWLALSALLGFVSTLLMSTRRVTVERVVEAPVEPVAAPVSTVVEVDEPAPSDLPVESPFPVLPGGAGRPWEAEEEWSRPARRAAAFVPSTSATSASSSAAAGDDWDDAAASWRDWADEAVGRSRERDDEELFHGEVANPGREPDFGASPFPPGAVDTAFRYDEPVEAAFPYAQPVEAPFPVAPPAHVASDIAERERVEAERLARLDAERAEAERLEAERLEAERLVRERLEAERREAERREQERLEAQRLEAERLTRERSEVELLEAARMARLEAQLQQAAQEEAEQENARLDAERREVERAEDASLPSTPYGPGSAYAPFDGSAPIGFRIKGHEATKLFHTNRSRFFSRIQADVWFDSEESATEAGFTRWDQRLTTAHHVRHPAAG